MKTTRNSAIALAAAFAVLAGIGTPVATAADDLAAQVTAAKTAADHEALAAEYDKKAAAAKAEAALHRKMGEAYKGVTATAIGKSPTVSAMPQHCEKLAARFEEEAKMYETMAATERELAKTAK